MIHPDSKMILMHRLNGLRAYFPLLFILALLPACTSLGHPTTLLWYSVVVNVYGGTWDTLQIVVAVIAVVIDLSPGGSRRR